ncbi:transcription elongation factor B polypeptide 3, partial [Austrofundulus limnaeus]|uniref:Transcription elongation factor B polypeptide 3 n=1 Tax=Austrofundulus limnaeus TaxID=52670 RepID=A0A2I4CIX1_AUSLI
MAEQLLETVERLQTRIQDSPEPRKLLKTLKRLGELPMTVDILLETVERLQTRIQDSPEPRKLLKTLKRLGELPMTVDILVETGVGKTVNSFRKHEVVGDLAKSLVAKWKKLVPQSSDRPNSLSKDSSQSHQLSQGHRGHREPSPEEEPSYMEKEEEEEEEQHRGYHTNYSPSPPHQNQY